MKRIVFVISLLFTLLVLTVGYKTAYADSSASYCLITDSNTGASNQEQLMSQLQEKIDGHLIDPETTEEAIDEVMGTGVPVENADYDELQAIGQNLEADYVIVLRSYNDTQSYEDVHTVDCELDIIKVGSDIQKIFTGNFTVPVEDNVEDETYNALDEFLESMEPLHL